MLDRNRILIFMMPFFSYLSSGATEVCYNILGVNERISRKKYSVHTGQELYF